MGLFEILGLAFLGGLALNITPCILPVLSIKIMSFIKMAKGSRIKSMVHGGLYSIGITLSFLVLGGITVGLQALTGTAIFGGLMLTSSWFNGAMAVIMASLGLHMLGATRVLLYPFKVLLNKLKMALSMKSKAKYRIGVIDKIKTYLTTTLLELKTKLPYLGSFFHGCLTTFIGSACCGPMLAYSMGIALSLGTPSILLAFLFAGIGMSLPYLLLPAVPGLTKVLPKSGRWMIWVERICALMIILTSVWFGYLASMVLWI